MSIPPAYSVRRTDLSDRQRHAQVIVAAESGGGFAIAPVLDFPPLHAPNQMTHRVSDWAPPAPARPLEPARDGDLEKIRAITCELKEFGHLPRAAQLPPVSGLPPIDGVAVADVHVAAPNVHVAAPKRITVKPVAIWRQPVPPVRPRSNELSRPAKFLVAVAIGAPLAGYFAIAGPYPMFGEAAVPEVRSVQPPSLTVQPFPQGPTVLVNQNAVRDMADAAPEPRDAKLRTEEDQTVGVGERVAQPPPNREAGGNDVAAVDGRDAVMIADSDPLSLTRSELETLSRFAWYRPTAWTVLPKPTGSIEQVNAPATVPIAAIGPLPTRKDVRKDFILADSGRQSLTREELQGLSIDQLVIARNEIFARKGRYFKEEALRDYFSQFSWYQPHAWDVTLSTIEQANVELIQSVEGSKHATTVGRAR